MAAPTSPKYVDFLPAGVTPEQWSSGPGRLMIGSNPGDYEKFITRARVAGTQQNRLAQMFGGADKYIAADNAYQKAYAKYISDLAEYNASQGAPAELVESQQQRANNVLTNVEQTQSVVSQDKQQRVDNRALIRNELETQYNNLVKFDPRLAYQGRSSDLPRVFDQQAAQLANAGVTSIANLRNQDGRLVDASTGLTVDTSNLGGQITVDRDTGVQKWGDIFSGVKGGANYGIAFASDGSPIFFPAWEKTKSPIAQIGLGGLESVITPILTIGGAMIGAGPTGSVAGAALGAGVGSTTGQLLASGEVDWEKVALSAASAGAGQYVSGLLGGEAAAADLTGTTTGGMLGPDAGFQVATGGQLASATDLANAAFIAEDAAQLYQQTGNIAAVQQNLIGAGVDPIIAAEAANLSSLGFNAAQIASNLSPSMIGEIYGPSAGTLRIEDLAFVGDDAAQLYQQTGNVAAVQQNLIAAGVDPIIAAEASNLAALGQAGPNIASNLNQAFPGDQVFTSEGLLSGGSTMDDFARDIGGNITSSAAPAIGINDALNLARTGANLLGGQQQQGGLLGGGQVSSGGRQVSGVDYSGLLSLLQGQTRTPGIASLLTPVVMPVANPYQALLSPQPQYQPLSLLG